MVKMKLSEFSLVKCTGGVNVVFDSEPSRVCSQSQFFIFACRGSRGIRRSEVRFLVRTYIFFPCPTLVTRRKTSLSGVSCCLSSEVF